MSKIFLGLSSNILLKGVIRPSMTDKNFEFRSNYSAQNFFLFLVQLIASSGHHECLSILAALLNVICSVFV
jgi:hypothetical protein